MQRLASSSSTGMPEPPYRLLMQIARTAAGANAGSPTRACATQPAMHSIDGVEPDRGHCSAHSGCGVSGW